MYDRKRQEAKTEILVYPSPPRAERAGRSFSASRTGGATFFHAQWSASFTILTPAGRDAQLEKAVEILKGELKCVSSA